MLRAISANIDMLDNKQLVDTLFSVGKLHKELTLDQIAKEAPLFINFYNRFLASMLKEAKSRLP